MPPAQGTREACQCYTQKVPKHLQVRNDHVLGAHDSASVGGGESGSALKLAKDGHPQVGFGSSSLLLSRTLKCATIGLQRGRLLCSNILARGKPPSAGLETWS